jgi:regulator of replication initiation timing
MSDRGGRRGIARVGEAGMREMIFLKNKLRDAHGLLQKYVTENQSLKEDNQFLRRLLWDEMTRRDETKEVDMDEVMEDP